MDDPGKERLRLRCPALAVWRSPGVLQVGLDSPALVLDGVPERITEALALLAHPNTAAELASLLPGLDPAWVGWLITELAAADLLVRSESTPNPLLAVVGTGPLAESVIAAMAGAGLSAQRVEPGTVFATRPVGAEDSGAAITVLAGPAAEPDRTLTDALFRAGRAHLVVRLEPDRAVVGPMVLPGCTPCVRCLDLSRCRLDPAWPRLLAQLCREQAEPDPALTAWAANTAAVQVLAWLAGGVPETGGSSLELGLADFRLRSRRWPAHPRCGCLVPIG